MADKLCSGAKSALQTVGFDAEAGNSDAAAHECMQMIQNYNVLYLDLLFVGTFSWKTALFHVKHLLKGLGKRGLRLIFTRKTPKTTT